MANPKKVYLDKYGQEVAPGADYIYFEIREIDPKKKLQIRRRYDKKERLLRKASYQGVLMEGLEECWRADGSLKSKKEYKQGKLNGFLRDYWPNGQLKRKDLFKAGELIRGTCFDEGGKVIPYFANEVLPQYHGGHEEMLNLLKSNLQYPPRARQLGIEGKVMVRFVIDENGRAVDHEVVERVAELLDEEALRVVKLLTDWEAGEQNGKKGKSLFQSAHCI